jgi:chemotaxis regulatin CheY-phosphate phosphatase CheZ
MDTLLDDRSPMPHPSASEAIGRQVLSIFNRHRVPAGGTLTRNYFFDVRDADFQRGIDTAAAHNWITVDARNRYRYILTAAGFAAGRTLDCVGSDRVDGAD